jgi:hypothetical protein
MINTTEIITSISASWLVDKNYHYEGKIRESRSHYWTAIYQISAAGQAFDSVNRVMKGLGKSMLSGKVKVACMAAPALFAFLSNRSISSRLPNHVIHFTREHIGLLSNAVTVISTVALIAFGNYLVVGVSVGYFAARLVLPGHLSNSLELTGNITSIAISIFFGNPLDKVLAVVFSVEMTAGAILGFRNWVNQERDPIPSYNIADVLNSLDREEVVIDKEHLKEHINGFPTTIPGIEKAFLGDNLAGVDLSELDETSFWKERGSCYSSKEACLREGIRKFMDCVQKDARLKDYYCCLVPLLRDDINKYDALPPKEKVSPIDPRTSIVKLAIAGLYGEAAVSARLRSSYNELRQKKKPEWKELNKYILELLQRKRDQDFRAVYGALCNESWWLRSCGLLFDLQEASWYNSYINTYGSEYNLMDCSDDEMGQMSLPQVYLWSRLDRRKEDGWDGRFFTKYSEVNIVAYVLQYAKNDALAWAVDRGIPEGATPEKIVRAMLVSMGIFKFKDESS